MKYRNIYKLEINKPDLFHFHHGANIISGDDREFKLHMHPHPEIYIYISGRAEFYISGTSFNLNPYDVILVPANTLHQPIPTIGEFFERFVLNIPPSFYKLMNCTELEDVFFNLTDFKYKIPGYIVKRSGILNFTNYFKNDYNSKSKYEIPLIMSKIIDLLYRLNTINKFEGFDTINNVIQDLINHIDANYKTIYDLESLALHFPYSKNHLSFLFKKYTGMTIMKYINLKKLENVENLYKQGKSLMYACIESGFTSYDSFAYFYKKELGVSPKKGFLDPTKKIKL